jgi:hypothetical protein
MQWTDTNIITLIYHFDVFIQIVIKTINLQKAFYPKHLLKQNN